MQSLRLQNGSYLRYHDLAGTGMPVVFIHGLGCASSCDYPAVARDGALAGKRLVLVDPLGYGFSDKPASFPYGVEAHAATVRELVEHLGEQKVDLYGHSMGGAVAIAAAVLLGERVRRLVLSEPNLDPGGGLVSRAIAGQPEVAHGGHGQATDVVGALASGNLAWAGSAGTAAPHALKRDARSLVKGAQPTWREQLLALQVPRTVIFGARSLPDADHAGLPGEGVWVDVVPEAGHSMATENPAGLAAALARALA